jgi:hypothetical protein
MRPDPIEHALRNLPRRIPPVNLRTSLRVLASREQQRQLSRKNLGAMLGAAREWAELFFDNVVRGFAVPAAGGVFAAIVLFIMFVVPAYPLRIVHGFEGGFDVPTELTTMGSLKSMGTFGASESDVVVDVAVDEQGRMIDYMVVVGASVLANSEIRRRLENALLFSTFTPATRFGQPTPSTVRVWFRSSRIDVRG